MCPLCHVLDDKNVAGGAYIHYVHAEYMNTCGTSDKGPSEKGTTSQQRSFLGTFPIAVHFNLHEEDNLSKRLVSKCRLSK